MPGIAQVQKQGPFSYTPAAGVTVLGGQVVEGAAGGRIAIAGVGSTKHLGVALFDAIAPEQVVTTPAGPDATQRYDLLAHSLPTKVAVAANGIVVKVTYAANANFGDPLICAANGTVTPAGAAPDARFIVGKCAEPLGVTVGTNAVGKMRTA